MLFISVWSAETEQTDEVLREEIVKVRRCVCVCACYQLSGLFMCVLVSCCCVN